MTFSDDKIQKKQSTRERIEAMFTLAKKDEQLPTSSLPRRPAAHPPPHFSLFLPSKKNSTPKGLGRKMISHPITFALVIHMLLARSSPIRDRNCTGRG